MLAKKRKWNWFTMTGPYIEVTKKVQTKFKIVGFMQDMMFSLMLVLQGFIVLLVSFIQTKGSRAIYEQTQENPQ